MPVVTYSGNVYTLADAAKRKDPSGAAVSVLEVLNQVNDIISDAPAIECNNGSTHVTTIRDSIPKPKFRMLNQGTPSVKSGMRQITESTGVLDAWSEVDKALLDLCSDVAEKRSTLVGESKAVIEGMSQSMVQNLFYGDIAIDPAGFDGFSKRYNSLAASNPVSRQVIDAGGTGANLTSIWLIQWDKDGSHLLYPKGVAAGIKTEVHDNQILRDSAGNPFVGVMSHFYWYIGLAVRDWRRVVRIANVDTSALNNIIANGVPTAAGFALMRQMMYAIDLLPNRSAGRTVFYMNRIPHTMLNMMGSEKGNVTLQYQAPQGTPPYTTFLGVPLRHCDGLVIGEDRVV